MRKLIVGLLCLAGLAVVIDFGVAAYSEYRLSMALRAGAHLAADPEVTFHGFPFLRQAYAGHYDKIEITARSRRDDLPGEVAVEATLTGVRVPFGDLAAGHLSQVSVQEIAARMVLKPLELQRLFHLSDLAIYTMPPDFGADKHSPGDTDTSQLILTATLPSTRVGQFSQAPGGDRVSVVAELRIDGNQVQLTATDFYQDPDNRELNRVPAAEAPAVLAEFTRSIDTADLPFGITPTKVVVLGGEIIVEGTGTEVTINLDRFRRATAPTVASLRPYPAK